MNRIGGMMGSKQYPMDFADFWYDPSVYTLNMPGAIGLTTYWHDRMHLSGSWTWTLTDPNFVIPGRAAWNDFGFQCPVPSATGLNGKPAMLYDGINTTPWSDGATIPPTSGASIFMVLKMNNLSGKAPYSLGSYSAETKQAIYSYILSMAVGGGDLVFFFDGYSVGRVSFSNTGIVLLALRYDGTQSGNAARLRGYINGVQQSLVFAGPDIGTQTQEIKRFCIGFVDGAVTSLIDGLIGDFFGVFRAVSDNDFNKANQWCLDKYGIT